MTTSVVYAAANDGDAYGESTTYATARSTATAVDLYGSSATVGQIKSGSTYYIYEGFEQFDTSVVGADAISAAILSLRGTVDGSVTDFTIEARSSNWGASLTTDDYVPGASLAGLTEVAHYDTASGWATAWHDFADDALPANVNKTGITYILLDSSRHVAGNQPSGNEYVSYSTEASSYPPYLTITHAPAPILLAGTSAGQASDSAVLTDKASPPTPPNFPSGPGLAVQVWSADASAMLAILGNVSDVGWTDLFCGVGSGSCRLSIYDSACTAGNVAQGNLIKLCLEGSPVFAFFNTSPVLEIGEANTSVVTLAGSSVLAYTARARVDPLGGWATPTGTTRSGGEATMGGTFGGILLQLIKEAQLRGTIPTLKPQFTAAADSLGNAWAANCSALTFAVGCSLQDVILKLVALGMGVYMDPQLNLYAYAAGVQGANLASTVIFQEGRHFTAPVDRNGQAIKGGRKLVSIGSGFSNAVLAIGTGGVYEEATDATVSNPNIGRWESSVDLSSTTADTTLLSAAAAQQIVLTETASSAITVNLIHDQNPGGFQPYVSCMPGDTIALNVPGQYSNTPARIVAYTIAQIDGANYTWQASLGSIALPIGLRLAQMLASSSGTTSNVSGGVAGNLTLGHP